MPRSHSSQNISPARRELSLTKWKQMETIRPIIAKFSQNPQIHMTPDRPYSEWWVCVGVCVMLELLLSCRNPQPDVNAYVVDFYFENNFLSLHFVDASICCFKWAYFRERERNMDKNLAQTFSILTQTTATTQAHYCSLTAAPQCCWGWLCSLFNEPSNLNETLFVVDTGAKSSQIIEKLGYKSYKERIYIFFQQSRKMHNTSREIYKSQYQTPSSSYYLYTIVLRPIKPSVTE